MSWIHQTATVQFVSAADTQVSSIGQVTGHSAPRGPAAANQYDLAFFTRNTQGELWTFQ